MLKQIARVRVYLRALSVAIRVALPTCLHPALLLSGRRRGNHIARDRTSEVL
ncbi:hypothetical protein JYU34_012217 [Plutella xylostella]|uniref:Uncharacterized protein n=1 Tax=Plutella xylostella TaxID=51655 RepID=A0ABQ7QEQ0_PLUXY|nr:hypothetical protein JYU34_012217 [Plutella xylostella]